MIKQISITARIIFSCFVAITIAIFVDNFRRYKWACFLLFLCWTENLIILWASENVLVEIWHVFDIYYSGNGPAK